MRVKGFQRVNDSDEEMLTEVDRLLEPVVPLVQLKAESEKVE